MKQCPTCKRTYADDGFTFCLEDGALLSAPYNSEEKAAKTIRASGPPPTAVLPQARVKADVPSTVAATPRPPMFADYSESSASNSGLGRILLIVGAGVLIAAGGIYLIVTLTQRAQCPQFKLSCSAGETGTVACEAFPIANASANAGAPFAMLRTPLALQAPAFPHAKNVTWSSSAGQVESHYTMARIIAPGMSGQTITVNATVEFDSGCSRTETISYRVP